MDTNEALPQFETVERDKITRKTITTVHGGENKESKIDRGFFPTIIRLSTHIRNYTNGTYEKD